MTKDEELALDLALEALERMKGYGNVFLHRRDERNPHEQVCEAINAIKQARSTPVQDQSMFDCGVQPRPLSHPLRAYHIAMSEGPLHYEWTDKPHRLVYDLIAAVRFYANRAAPVQEPVAWPRPEDQPIDNGPECEDGPDEEGFSGPRPWNSFAQPAPVQEPEYVYTCNGCDTLYREDDVSCDCTVHGLMQFTRHILMPDTTPPAQPATENSSATQPAPVEPLEYWNAVEGWVKIDEVREHFDSVGCGTIYKTAGDGRVPLTAAQPAVPDAIIEAGESPEFRDGWNECRETMLQMLKARKP